jgi:hypothetical protein
MPGAPTDCPSPAPQPWLHVHSRLTSQLTVCANLVCSCVCVCVCVCASHAVQVFLYEVPAQQPGCAAVVLPTPPPALQLPWMARQPGQTRCSGEHGTHMLSRHTQQVLCRVLCPTAQHSRHSTLEGRLRSGASCHCQLTACSTHRLQYSTLDTPFSLLGHTRAILCRPIAGKSVLRV